MEKRRTYRCAHFVKCLTWVGSGLISHVRWSSPVDEPSKDLNSLVLPRLAPPTRRPGGAAGQSCHSAHKVETTSLSNHWWFYTWLAFYSLCSPTGDLTIAMRHSRCCRGTEGWNNCPWRAGTSHLHRRPESKNAWVTAVKVIPRLGWFWGVQDEEPKLGTKLFIFKDFEWTGQ